MAAPYILDAIVHDGLVVSASWAGTTLTLGVRPGIHGRSFAGYPDSPVLFVEIEAARDARVDDWVPPADAEPAYADAEAHDAWRDRGFVRTAESLWLSHTRAPHDPLFEIERAELNEQHGEIELVLNGRLDDASHFRYRRWSVRGSAMRWRSAVGAPLDLDWMGALAQLAWDAPLAMR